MSENGLGRAVIIISLLFFSTILIGWVGTAQNHAVGEEFMKMFEKDVARQVMGGSDAEVGGKLFLNNLEACLLLFLGGASFGIFTIFIMSLNGIVIGAILEIVHEQHSAAFVAAAILPHGIFEIPGFIIAGALGIMLSQSLVNEYYGKGDAAADTQRLARNFVLLVLPLIAVAALVEAFITPQVIQLVI
jgi:stage II sporulation protein M